MGICPRCKENNEFPGDGLCTWCYRVVYKAQDECFVRAEKRRAKEKEPQSTAMLGGRSKTIKNSIARSSPKNNREESEEMKATGMIRKIDDLGRVVVPKELRKMLGIKEGDPMEIYMDDGGRIILQKYNRIGICLVCGAGEDVREVRGKYVCVGCCKAVLEGQS